jgi:hypothetical protein
MIRIVFIGCCLLAAMDAPAGVAGVIVRSDGADIDGSTSLLPISAVD